MANFFQCKYVYFTLATSNGYDAFITFVFGVKLTVPKTNMEEIMLTILREKKTNEAHIFYRRK